MPARGLAMAVQKMIGGGQPLLCENLENDDPLFYLFSPVAPQPSHVAKKFN